MSSKEMAHSLVDRLTEKQLEVLIAFLDMTFPEHENKNNDEEKPKAKKTAASIRGILHDVANPALIPFENEEAWAEAAVEKHIRLLEEEKNDNS